MRISVFGLGYVGCVSAACLARDGHAVIGVDVSQYKIDLLAGGRPPVSEPGLAELLASVVATGQLRVGRDAEAAVQESDVSLICVGTPSSDNGALNLQYVENVCRQIGAALPCKQGYHVVVVRSTVLPGTVCEQLVPILEQLSHRRAGREFGVCMNPEFLREGSAIEDYYHPGYILLGQIDARCGDVVERMYAAVEAPVVRTTIPTAEMAKYVSNTFHAVKVTFANEIGNLCKAQGVDGQEVMDIFCRDHRLSISASYLKPGFAFGGSCLPKDLQALTHRARELAVDTPLLSAAWQSNQLQIQRAIEMAERAGQHRIGILGLSFKPNTDDVRESPTIYLIETLIARGYEVLVYDEIVDPAKLIGANRAFLERELPHIASIMRPSIEAVVESVEVVVIANGSPAFGRVPSMLRTDQVLIDLIGIAKGARAMRSGYEGICW
jgi:GDP-mannose 6-dehydrogenase